jgi:tRNA dimethylallyltransferase
MRELIVVCGPTASGKTAAAVELCLGLGGEVVSADSMQVYRGMDIGTAKPTPEEMRGVPHHLLGFLEPGAACSAAAYREAAISIIEDIFARGKVPVVCGGTGLYIDALTQPLGFSAQGDESVRKPLEEITAQEGGKERLHNMLRQVDPESAARLHVNDVRRVVRALEIYQLTGKTLSQQRASDREKEGAYRGRLFGLDWPREELYRRIDQRVDQMMAEGLADEVRALLQQEGLSARSTAMQGIGYKEIARALSGECSMEEAVASVKQATRNYAKRQLTWFKRDERVQWIQAAGRSARDISREILARKDQP